MSKCFMNTEWNACCCTCQFQHKIMKHPGNDNSYANGSILEIMGYGCTVPGWDGTIFFDREHSMCEEYNPKESK